MNKPKRTFVLLLALALCLSLLVASAGAAEETAPSGSSTSYQEEEPTIITLSTSNLSLYVGKSASLNASVQPDGKTVAWSSSNPDVAAVDKNGEVTAKMAGTCTITAAVDGVEATCSVTVKKPTIKLNKSSLSLDVKKTATLKATVDGPSKTVTWKSSDTKIATVDKNGKVTAKKEGKCTITATANKVSAKCTVKVLSEKEKAIEAYKKFLSQKTIYWLEVDYIPSNECSFNLLYLDNDEVPELVVQEIVIHTSLPGTSLYAYKDGKIKLVTAAEGYSYYPKKGVFVSLNNDNGGRYSQDYCTYSKGKIKEKLRFYHGIDWDASKNIIKNGYTYKNWYYKYNNNKQEEITKSAFNKALKQMVSSTKKSTPKAHKNTKANRKKYLK